MSASGNDGDDGDPKGAVAAELAKLEALLLGHGHATGGVMDASERLARAARTVSGHALPAAAPTATPASPAVAAATHTPKTGVRRVDEETAAAAEGLTERFAALRGQKR